MTGTEDEAARLVAALLERAEHAPEQVVCVAGDEEWTAARLAQESADVGAGLRAFGVTPGSRVALHLHNTVHAVITYLACLRIGAVALAVSPRASTTEMTALVESAGPVVYVGDPRLYPSFTGVPQSLVPTGLRFLVPGGGTEAAVHDVRRWDELYGAVPVPPERVSLQAPAVLLPTSGTAGPSKLVVWSYRTLDALSLSAARRGVVPGDASPLSTPLITSLMHSAGLGILVKSLTQGITVVLVADFEAGEVLDTMQARGCSFVVGLPFMCAQLAREQRARPRALPALRHAAVGGDVCPGTVEADFEAVFGIALLSVWGASEDVGATLPGDRPGPFVQAAPETSVTVVDAEGREVPDGQPGEMLISSPTTSPGYWLREDRTEPHPGGVLHTGDVVVRLGPRLLRFVGRSKDMIVRGGSNISPLEVEGALRDHPGVVDAAVAGVFDTDLGQRVGAALVLDRDRRVSVQDVLRDVGRDLAAHKVPEQTVVVDAVPRTGMTKVDRAAVARLLGEHHAR